MRTELGNAEYLRRRYAIQRAFFIEILGGRCVECGTTEGLEIDHRDPSTKAMDLGRLFSRRTIVAAVTELVTKCQVLCDECHNKKTRVEIMAGPRRFRHGTVYGWMKAKCSCEQCNKAKKVWHNERNQKRRVRS